MTVTHGFELIREQEIPEINTRARIYRHVRTGAELISMENDDENKSFGITFATPPADSTGLPHILEHAVLCGSRKYPVKDPFIQLAKGSLNTFLNAMTFSDKTTYPFASTNLQDFYNLLDVYLDAVFFPRISPDVLQQEGWHYELETADAPLAFKGVVFNEMKGAYSSPDNLLGRVTEQSLFPDTVYSHDSGGDPAAIPDLTYEDFKSFHETYYHPSNARIWFYGDDDPQERLRRIDEFIQEFERINVNAEIPLQPRFDEPHVVKVGYEPGDEEKAMVTYNWLLTENSDPETSLGLGVLEHILIGTPASPLRKALIESGLGEDLTGGGIDTQVREMYFTTGLKGIQVDNVDKIEALIFDTLRELAENGIDPEMIEAALNTAEFRLREYNTGGFPRGLAMMITALSTWLYDKDPLAPLAFEAPLAGIKARLENGEHYFEGLIEQFLLNNPHRTTVLLEPDAEANKRREEAEKARLEAVRAKLNADDLQAMIEDTLKLQQMQVTGDTPEALATIPSLKLSDLDRESKKIPTEVLEAHGRPLLVHDLFTNGIAYLDLAFNLRGLPQAYLPYLGLFTRALFEMGTETEDYVKLTQRIGRKTGGVYASTFISSLDSSEQSTAWLMLRGKGTITQTADLLDIVRDVLLMVKLDNRERFKQMVLEDKAGLESGLVPGGHRVVSSRLRSYLTEAGWIGEQMGGVTQLFFLRDLVKQIDNNWESVLAALEDMRRIIVNRDALIANVTLDDANWTQFQPQLESFIGALPAAATSTETWTPAYSTANEGLTIPAQVNYVGKGGSLYKLGYKHHGSAMVIQNFLGTSYLWERIRVQGGAYGGFATFDRHSGVFAFLSYRDPNLLKTLDNYDGTAKFLRELDMHPDELTKNIVGTIGNIDAYQLPDAKGYTALVRYLLGDTDEARQQRREEVLGTTAEDFRKFGETLEALNEAGLVVVLGSKDAIEAANAERKLFSKVTKVL